MNTSLTIYLSEIDKENIQKIADRERLGLSPFVRNILIQEIRKYAKPKPEAHS